MTTTSYEETASVLRSKAADKVMLIGPLVNQPSDGLSAKVDYVMVCTGDERKHFQCDRVFCHDEEGRKALIFMLARPGYVLIDMNDELEMAKQAKALWPCKKINQLVRDIRDERKDVYGS